MVFSYTRFQKCPRILFLPFPDDHFDAVLSTVWGGLFWGSPSAGFSWRAFRR